MRNSKPWCGPIREAGILSSWGIFGVVAAAAAVDGYEDDDSDFVLVMVVVVVVMVVVVCCLLLAYSSSNSSVRHTEIEVADGACFLAQSQYSDIRPTRPSTDPITPDVLQGIATRVQLLSHWHNSTVGSGLFVGCLTSQQQASVSQGRICSDNFTCCHTEVEVADPTFYLTQSQYTDTGPTSPSADPITPGAWQGSHWSASV